MDFCNLVSLVLDEGYLNPSREVTNFLNSQFIPKLKETTLAYKDVLVFDIVKAAKTGNYDQVHQRRLGKHISYDFVYKLEYNDPKRQDRQLTVWIIYTNLRTTASAVFERLQKSITIYIPCVSLVGNDDLASRVHIPFLKKKFDKFTLSELEQEFKESLIDIDNSYLSHMLKGATFKRTMNNIEHEFIHAIDPSSYQTKDNSKETLKKYDKEYLADYYGKPNANSGKIPAEFNPFFWNIIRSFQTPLNPNTKKFLLDFIKDPQPVINKLKLFDIETLNIGQISSYILNLFKSRDKDYTTFMKILNDKHHRKLLIRIFEDGYIKKKFLQKLYTFIENN